MGGAGAAADPYSQQLKVAILFLGVASLTTMAIHNRRRKVRNPDMITIMYYYRGGLVWLLLLGHVMKTMLTLVHGGLWSSSLVGGEWEQKWLLLKGFFPLDAPQPSKYRSIKNSKLSQDLNIKDL